MSDVTQKVRYGGRARRLGLALPLLFFAVLAGLFWYALHGGDPSRLPSALLGKPVPVFTLPPLEGLADDGKEVPGFASTDLAQGERTMVNVFASWCLECQEEHPLLVALANEPGIRLFGIDYKDDAAARAALPRPLRQSLFAGRRRFIGTHGDRFRRLRRARDLRDHPRRQNRLPTGRAAQRKDHQGEAPAAAQARAGAHAAGLGISGSHFRGHQSPSFRRKPESASTSAAICWIPACVGTTTTV